MAVVSEVTYSEQNKRTYKKRARRETAAAAKWTAAAPTAAAQVCTVHAKREVKQQDGRAGSRAGRRMRLSKVHAPGHEARTKEAAARRQRGLPASAVQPRQKNQ